MNIKGVKKIFTKLFEVAFEEEVFVLLTGWCTTARDGPGHLIWGMTLTAELPIVDARDAIL